MGRVKRLRKLRRKNKRDAAIWRRFDDDIEAMKRDIVKMSMSDVIRVVNTALGSKDQWARIKKTIGYMIKIRVLRRKVWNRGR